MAHSLASPQQSQGRRQRSPRRQSTLGPLASPDEPTSAATMAAERNRDSIDNDPVLAFANPHLFTKLPEADHNNPEYSLSDFATLSTQALVARSTLLSLASFAQTQIVSTGSAADHNAVLHLWTIRLAALSLLGLTDIAETEAQTLHELNLFTAAGTNTATATAAAVPWNLRVTAIKLQTRANGGPLGIVKYYSLAREARTEAWKARKNRDALKVDADNSDGQMELWESRLLECGLFVAALLCHIKDFAAATSHLQAMFESLTASTSPGKKRAQMQIATVAALLNIEMGEAKRAAEWFATLAPARSELEPVQAAKNVTAVEPEHDDGDEKQHRDSLFESGQDSHRANEPPMAQAAEDDADGNSKCNHALAHLSEGNIEQARSDLQQLLTSGFRFSDLIFNFCVLDKLKHEISTLNSMALN